MFPYARMLIFYNQLNQTTLFLPFSGQKNGSAGKKPLEPGTVDILKNKLKEEYEFYHFVRQNFHKKFSEILAQK